MLFNSVEFLIFLPIVFSLYWLINGKNVRAQNTLLVISSYFFYGWWDWRFLALIAFSSLVDYLVGIGLGRAEDTKKRKLLLLTSISVNIGFLGFFKYFNFFAESFQEAFTFLGAPISDPIQVNVVLPVGISFYTFQTLSYSIDLYRKKLQPTKDIVSFLLSSVFSRNWLQVLLKEQPIYYRNFINSESLTMIKLPMGCDKYYGVYLRRL